MNDLISRKQAVEAINRYGSVWMEYTEDMSVDEIAERALKASKQSMVKILHDLPSAQPERKKGRWIDKSGGIDGAWNYCSVCGEQAIDLFDFCPNCGSYNGGEEE